jgi:biopolymer transport protein ExbD
VRPVQPRATRIQDGLGLAAVDVVMNLFLFFLIAFALLATFHKTDAAQPRTQPPTRVLDLPASDSARAPAPQGAVVVEVGASGELFIDGAPVERAALTAALQARLGDEKRPVVLRSSKQVPLGDAVELIDLVNAAAPASLSLTTVERAPAQP